MQCLIDFLNSQFISAFIGGLVGGLFTYLGVKRTIENEREESEQETRFEVKAYYQAISADLRALLSRYHFQLEKLSVNSG